MMENNKLELVQAVNESLGELISGDVIKEIITKQLESTITEIVRDSMKSYSDFGKTIKDKINSVVCLAASNVELPEYTKFVSGVVLEQFDKVLQEQSKTQLNELIISELGVLPSGVMTARQLAEKIKSTFESDEYEEERTVEVEIEGQGTSGIYIEIKDEERSEEIKISLYNHSQKNTSNYYIGYLDTGGWTSRNTRTSERSLNTHCMDEIEKFLFRLYCAQTKIDMSDTSDFEDFNVGGNEH
jgi:hypothetical protein